jgi:hypothetical protein
MERRRLAMEYWLCGDEVIVDFTVLCDGLALFVYGELDDVLNGGDDGLGVLETGGHAILGSFSGECAHEVGGIFGCKAKSIGVCETIFDSY